MEHLKNKNYEISNLYLNKAINANENSPILFEKSINIKFKIRSSKLFAFRII